MSDQSRSGGSLSRARAAVAAWQDLDDDNDAWLEVGPLREGLRGITAEDAVALLADAHELGSPTNHELADEIIAALLPEAVRECYWRMQDGGAWWYA